MGNSATFSFISDNVSLMIKFFRKNRQDLLSENKFGKYLTYATGEIILVVIGILIALQINNWNETKKNERIKAVYLQDFVSDLKTDIKILTTRIAENGHRINAIDSISSILSTNTKLSEKESTKFIENHYHLATESYFTPERATIQQFESNINGNSILPKKIRDRLYRYYAMNERMEKNDEKSLQLYQHNFITKHILTPIIEDVPEKGTEFKWNKTDLYLKNLKKDKDYLFALTIKKGITANQNYRYELIIETAEKIIELIDAELTE